MVQARRRLLVVEDDAEIRTLLDRALRRDFDVTQVGDAESAVELLGDEATSVFDVVISDYALPGKTGINLLSWMRATPGICELPVLIISGHGESIRVRALDVGADGFLSKPFVISDLRRALDSAITERARPH